MKGKRWIWLSAAALVGCSSAVLLYSSEAPPRATRPTMATGASSTASASSAESEPLELTQFTPYLADARFSLVRDALEAEAPAVAANALTPVIAAAPAEEQQQLWLWQGLLWERAGNAVAALASCQRAVASAGVLNDYANACVARGLIATGQAAAALERLATPFRSPAEAERLRLTAQAARLSGNRALALSTQEASLALARDALERARASLALAELLLSGTPSDADSQRALLLAREASPALVSRDDDSARAKQLEAQALAALPNDRRQAQEQPSAAEQLAQIRALVDARRHELAEQQAQALSGSLELNAARLEDRCEAWLLRARALAGLRRFSAALDALSAARDQCNADLERAPRVWFLSGRYAQQAGRPADAIPFFSEVEQRFHTNSLADDARFQAAIAEEELGAQARATELLLALPEDYPNGDMAAEGIFRLALRQMERPSWPDALGLLERGVSLVANNDAARGFELAGRERFFRARAWLAIGERERALAEFEAVVQTFPLSYYMLQAYSWLLREDAARAAAALARAEERAEAEPFRIAKRPELTQPGFERMMALLRIGELEPALAELDALGLSRDGVGSEILWAVAGLYERAGFSKYSTALARKRLGEVSGRWPVGAWSKPWEIAFPRPYWPVVARETKLSAVDPALAYAVMREESAFDPDVVSAANAYGLMQLILPTARAHAKAARVNVTARSLTRPAVNIAVGCRELAKLGAHFNDNPLLVVPAYNAGPGNADRWLRERPGQDFDLWVERIPFLETRRYTKRVLSSRAVYAFLYETDPETRNAHLSLPAKVASGP